MKGRLLPRSLGLISALITFAFQALVHIGQVLVWKQAAHAAGLPAIVFTLAVCVLGGLLVGVMVRIFRRSLRSFRRDDDGISAALAVSTIGVRPVWSLRLWHRSSQAQVLAPKHP